MREELIEIGSADILIMDFQPQEPWDMSVV